MRSSALRGLLLLWMFAGIERSLQGEELQWNAETLLSRSTVANLRLSADGKAVELIRGLLVETDGAAAGYSYKPNEELLGGTVGARKTLQLDPLTAAILAKDDDDRGAPPARAILLLGHQGKSLEAKVNGQNIKIGEPIKAGNYWKGFEFPTRLLIAGKNEIELLGDGKLWIARDDDRTPAGSEPARTSSSEQLSERERENKTGLLGPKNDIAGEYCIRLYLDGYLQDGALFTQLLDAANLNGRGIPAAEVTIKRLHVEVAGDWPAGSIIGVHQIDRTGEARVTSETSTEQSITLESATGAGPRIFFVSLHLLPEAASRSPRIRSLKIAADIAVKEDWAAKTLKIVDASQETFTSISRESDPRFGFRHERLDHPRLAEFRKQYALDDLVKGCTTDLARMEKIAVWTSQLWSKGHLGTIYPKWDALEILKKHEDGTPIGGFCQQYNIVFLQACEALGMPGRCVSIGAGDQGVKIRSGHEVVEIWSNELSKWVYVDGQAAWYFIDKETRTPLNLLELRQRQVAAFRGSPLSAVEVVVLAPSPYEWKGLEDWPAFTELRMIPHTQFLDGERSLPVNQGMRGWFWTGHRVWTDDRYPASILYGNRIADESNWNFPINRTRIHLQQGSEVGALTATLQSNMPSFAKYEVLIDDGAPIEIDAHRIDWPLQQGENRLQVRAINKLGLKGSASWIKLTYQP